MILLHESFQGSEFRKNIRNYSPEGFLLGWDRDLMNCSPEGLLLGWGAGRDVVEAMLLFERFFGGWIVFCLGWSSLFNVPSVKIAEVGGQRSAWESVKMSTDISFEPCWWTLESGAVDTGLRDILLSLGKGFDAWRWYGADPKPTSFIFVSGTQRDMVEKDVSFGASWEHVVEVPRYGSLEEMKMKMMLKGVS